jgi:hypothetical protein
LLNVHDGNTTNTDFGESLSHVESETTASTEAEQSANLLKGGQRYACVVTHPVTTATLPGRVNLVSVGVSWL